MDERCVTVKRDCGIVLQLKYNTNRLADNSNERAVKIEEGAVIFMGDLNIPKSGLNK